MAKKAATKGMHGNSNRKARGRTTISTIPAQSPTKPNISPEASPDANRPVKSGTGKHRGDRRDMSPLYTGNEKHAARGNNSRADVKTRKR